MRAVDYNVRRGQIFYTADDGIYSANINGSTLPVRIVDKSVYNPTGIAVDYVTGILLAANSQYTQI